MDKKNRLKFENLENEEEKYHSEIIEESPYYYENPKRSKFGIFLWTLLFLCIVGAFVAGYWYVQKKHPNAITNIWPFGRNKDKKDTTPTNKADKPKVLTNNESIQNSAKERLDQLLLLPYYPENSINTELARCINLYKNRQIKAAYLQCTDFVNSSSQKEDKSVALTILGVMYYHNRNFDTAMNKLKSAANYDKRNFYAYYNLALSYKGQGNVSQAQRWALKAKDAAPYDTRVQKLVGILLAESNAPEEGIENLRQAAESDPKDAELAYNLALALYKQGKIPEAIKNFRKVIAVPATSKATELANANLGSIYFHRDELDKAEHYFRQAVNLKPNSAHYLYNLGVVLIKRKRSDEAISVFEKALATGSIDPKVYRYIADSLVDLKKPTMAKTSLQRALKIQPNDVESLLQLADLEYARRNLPEAESLFRRVIKATPGDAYTESAYINLGIILDESQRYDEAVYAFQKAIQINSQNADAYYNLGIAYKNAGKPIDAENTWKKAIALTPNDTKNQEALGDYKRANGAYLEAANYYADIVKKDPSNYRIKLKLADAYLNNENTLQLAEKYLKDVLNYSKNGAEIKIAHRNLALLYSKNQDKSKAKDEAYRAAHMDPNDMQSRLILAKVLYDTGSLIDREKAIDELTTITNSDVNSKLVAQAFDYLGLCYYKNGEFKRAVRNFQSAIELDPTLTEAYEHKRAANASYEDKMQESSASF
ncbi:MAG: tetratricopeptide repeat protein [Spirochaetota bacterium]